MFVSKRIGRRKLFVYGHIGMAIAHTMVGCFSLYDMPSYVLASICLFVVVY